MRPSQFGQVCFTSIHSSMQHGIRQHPQKQQRQAITAPDRYARSPGRFSMLVRIVVWQCGHTTSIDFEAKATPRVTIGTDGSAVSEGAAPVIYKKTISKHAYFNETVGKNHATYLNYLGISRREQL